MTAFHDTQDLSSIAASLLAWAEKEGRRPPWRSVRDPYLLAVAEILLQKTKAEDVEPVWCKLISSFPAPSDLVRASDKEIQQIIGRLGLGSQRTERLRTMASAMLRSGRSESLPGLGTYGMEIVRLSVGETSHVAPVDTNIARVICRYYGLTFRRGEPRKQSEVKAAVKRLLDTQVGASRKLQAVYGLIDLGALVCVSGGPRCSVCPLVMGCSFVLATRPRRAT